MEINELGTEKAFGNLKVLPTIQSDRARIMEIVTSADFFSDEEGQCILELLNDYLGSNPSGFYYFLSCMMENELVGFICFGHRDLTQGAFDGYWMCTDHRCRGNGVGKSLVAALEARVLERRGYLVIMETSDSDKYFEARRLFETMNYRKMLHIRDFYAPDDGLVMYVKYLK